MGEKISILTFARELRKNSTIQENLLWLKLRNRQLAGYKIRRQHPIADAYVADFYCAEAKLVIEIDGPIHKRRTVREYDEMREEDLKYLGFKVIRFTNQEVDQNLPGVLKGIQAKIESSF